MQQGWTDITHWQVTHISERCKAVEDGEATPGIEVELRSGREMAAIVHLPTDGDALWFMDPSTGNTVRSIQLDKDRYKPADDGNSERVFRTGNADNETETDNG